MDEVLKVPTALVLGIKGKLFDIEITFDDQAAGLEFTGLSDAAAHELRALVVSAEGHPDLFFPGARVVVLVDGCFWHGCARCARPLS